MCYLLQFRELRQAHAANMSGSPGSWDDWVPQDRVRKDTEENRELAANLKSADAERHQKTRVTNASKKKAAGSDLSSTRGSEERYTPATGRGQKRGRDYEIEKVREKFPSTRNPRNELGEELGPGGLPLPTVYEESSFRSTYQPRNNGWTDHDTADAHDVKRPRTTDSSDLPTVDQPLQSRPGLKTRARQSLETIRRPLEEEPFVPRVCLKPRTKKSMSILLSESEYKASGRYLGIQKELNGMGAHYPIPSPKPRLLKPHFVTAGRPDPRFSDGPLPSWNTNQQKAEAPVPPQKTIQKRSKDVAPSRKPIQKISDGLVPSRDRIQKKSKGLKPSQKSIKNESQVLATSQKTMQKKSMDPKPPKESIQKESQDLASSPVFKPKESKDLAPSRESKPKESKDLAPSREPKPKESKDLAPSRESKPKEPKDLAPSRESKPKESKDLVPSRKSERRRIPSKRAAYGH